MTNNKSILTNRKGMISFFRYNMTNIFAGKFIYFILLAIAIFLTVVIIYSFEEETPPVAEHIYYFLLTPGVLLIFYPSVYIIQSDVDARMIETLFGIPDYRYKVWLARLIIQQVIIAFMIFMLALFCRFAMADFNIINMVYHVMFPLFFLSCLGFMLAALTRSGNGTAVIMVILTMIYWMLSEPLYESKYFLFYNPFITGDIIETYLLSETTFYNRVYLMVGGLVTCLFALLLLQRREKFV